ncbi:MAG: RsmD family RNA methyltransferase [Bacteroidota bacterium]
MRIISGSHKGRRLIAPKKLPVRPTTDMAKEALFNMLQHQFDFDNLTVIDLFSGTGNIAYEFASRGTENIYAVDANNHCVQYISKTSKALDFDITVLKQDVFRYLEKASQKADVIFADPPYGMSQEDLNRLVQLVFEKKLLLPEGLLILEHTPQRDFSTFQSFVQSRKYGSSVFSFFE